MAERVAEREMPEPLHEDALIAASNELMILLPKGPYNLRADAAAREEIVEQVVVAALDALPSEWLLARALTKEEIRLLRAGVPTFRGDYGAWDGAQRKLGAALSVLEQAGGSDR